MVLTAERSVEFSMVDLANIAYYPRIFDLAHRFFESVWPEICGQTYPHIINTRRLGFPVVNVQSEFKHPLRYGDTITARITFTKVGTTSLVWRYRFFNQDNQLVWYSTQTTVCVDMDTMEPQTIPDDVRKGVLLHLEPEASS
ncbi:MAG: acyl-CoA thioesterase [Poseidonia sp.]